MERAGHVPLGRWVWAMRALLAASCLALALGLTIDALRVVPHTTVRVRLVDGRHVTLEVQWMQKYVTDRSMLAAEITWHPDVAARRARRARWRPITAADITDVEIVRGPEYRLTDARMTSIALGLVVLAWIALALAHRVSVTLGRVAARVDEPEP